jgi:uncharacterized membrane protein YhhN
MYLYLFVAVAIGELVALLSHWDGLHTVCKPLLVPALLAFYLSHRNKAHQLHTWVIGGLFFGWIGDVALMFQEKGSLYFMVGLAAFLIGHICYIVAFMSTNKPSHTSIFAMRPYLALPLVGYAALMFWVLQPHVGALLIPVTVYMLVIITMALVAINRLGKVPMRSFLTVLSGAMCFVVSDSLLAFNKFVSPFPLAGFAIMLTYILAQYFIAVGCLQQVERI